MVRWKRCLAMSMVLSAWFGPAAAADIESCRTRIAELEQLAPARDPLLVVLPDPVVSPLGREFDAFVLALQQALAAEGYFQELACLTWKLDGEPGTAFRSEPSLLVYRRGNQALPVYLIGETAESGLHQDAMIVALDDVGPWTEGPVRILGPTFSGSATSLAKALGLSTVRRGLVIRSGTATGTDVEKTLLGSPGLQSLDYGSLARTSDELQDVVWNDLVPDRLDLATSWMPAGPEPGEPPTGENDRVALLVELSPYGAQFAVDAERQGFRVIRFPAHLAALRAAYERIARERSTGSRQDSHPGRGGSTVPMDLSIPSLQGIPAFGRTNTLSSFDLVLRQTLRQLARERVEVVGIVATSTADKIFLAESVRSFVPDARMITFEGDILLTHPDHFPSTSGMLVVSSNPLSRPDPFQSATAEPTGRDATRLHFDLDGAQGIYRAARQLLGSSDEAVEQAVFVTVVGRSGLTPIARYPEEAASMGRGDDGLVGAGAATTLSFDPRVLPTIWTLLVVLLSVGILVLAVRVVLDLRSPETGRCLLGLVPTSLVDPPRWGGSGQDRLLHALVVLLPVVVGTFYLVLALPALTPSQAAIGSLPWCLDVGKLALVTLSLVVLFGAAIYLLSGLIYRTSLDARQQPPAETWPRSLRSGLDLLGPSLLAFSATVLILWTGGACIRHLWTDGMALRSQLLARRALSLSSGVSPLIPTLLIVGVVLAWIVVALLWRERLRRVDPRLVVLPREVGGQAGDGLVEALRGMDLLRSGQRAWWWAALGVLVPFGYIMARQGGGRLTPALRSIESWQFDMFVTVLLAIAVFLTILAGVALHRGWRSLSEVLDETAHEPVVEVSGSRRQLPSLSRLAGVLPTPGDAPDATAAKIVALVSSRNRLDLELWLELLRWRGTAGADQPPTAFDQAIRELRARGTMFFIRLAFLHVGHLMMLLTLSLLALFLAVSSYPFEPRRMILVYLGALVLAAMAVSVKVILQAQGHKQLQESSGLGKASFGWRSLAQRLTVMAGLPVVSLAMGRFPELRRLLNDWIEPLITSLK